MISICSLVSRYYEKNMEMNGEVNYVSDLRLLIKIIGGWINMEQLHEHNQKTYENICRMYGEGIQRVAVVQPTGSGKSLLMAKLIEDNPNSRFFVLSTRHEINEQFKEKLDEKILKRIDFNIYCNMPNMKQEIMESLQPDYIFLDEMHRALAKEWSKGIMRLLEMYPDAKVLGLSATPIRYLDRCRNVVEELFGGNLACDMSLSEAILDGILPMARYVCGVYSYEKDAESLNKKIERSCNSNEEKKDLLRQVKILKENLDKGHGVSDIFRKYIVSGSEKFVVFLKDTTHLRVMKPVIEKWFTDAGFPVRLFEVHSKNTDKDKEFQKFKEDTEDGIIKACLSVNIVTEGIHGDIDGVIMLRDTISPNMYFQMIGRAFSCGKKTIPLIFDLVANSQFISDAADNFPNELRGEIEKRKKECEKEGKEYEVGFDVDEFIVMDEFMDVVSGFREIEGRLEGSWENGLKHFDKYVREHNGDVLVPKNYKDEDGFCTGNWVSNKREEYKNKILLPKRVEELNKRSFIWDVKKYDFTLKLEAIKRFISENGRLPKSMSKDWYEKKLGGFLVKERIYHNQDKVQYPKWRKDAMEEIEGFSWNPKEEYFLLGCKHYEDYLSKTSNFSIPKGYRTSDGFNLDSWVSAQKNKYRKNKLTDDEKDMLNRIGFCFSINNDNFDKLLKLMKEYIEVNHFDSDIPQATIYKGENLGAFVSSMRANYKNKSISNYRKEKLESIGFIWNTKDKQWNDNLQWFTKYKKEHGGKIDISKKDSTLKHYYYWLIDQRMLYRKGQMREDRRKLFEQVIMS